MLGLHENYHNLAIAIIGRAIVDYKAAYKRSQKRPNDNLATSEVAELRKFFLSGWFGLLSTTDGAYFLKRLDKEVAEEQGKKVKKRRYGSIIRRSGEELNE